MLRLRVQYTMDSRKWFLFMVYYTKNPRYIIHTSLFSSWILNLQKKKQRASNETTNRQCHNAKTAMLGPALQQLQIEHLNELPPTASGYQPQVLVGKILRFRQVFFSGKRGSSNCLKMLAFDDGFSGCPLLKKMQPEFHTLTPEVWHQMVLILSFQHVNNTEEERKVSAKFVKLHCLWRTCQKGELTW